jgi:hypothetical protein
MRSGRVVAALPVVMALMAGLALRLWMLRSVFQVNGDSLVYGGLAKNLLLHGQYDLTTAMGKMYPTLIRLPGYPIFLAGCFWLFGMENYYAASCVQIGLDLIGCLLLAGFARRIAPAAISRSAMLVTLWLAVLCPFTASYTAEPLTETLTIFVLALAMWAMARFRAKPNWADALWFTAAVSSATMLRPDGALAAIVFAFFLSWRRIQDVRGVIFPGPQGRRISTPRTWAHPWGSRSEGARRSSRNSVAPTGLGLSGRRIPRTASARAVLSWAIFLRSLRELLPGFKGETGGTLKRMNQTSDPMMTPGSPTRFGRMAAVCVLLALTPVAVWTARNWRVFHVIEPLAPRLATDPGESSNPGWERWMKSWCLDYISTYQIYWNVPGDQLDVEELPNRAFDSPAQYAETAALAADYNGHGMELTPEIDARFGRLADERIAANPLRSYVWLPLGRLADMWLRPRVEDMDIDLDWWVYSHHRAETRFCWAYAGLNAVFLALGIVGLCFRPRFWGAMLAYIVLRSALLLTVEAPETRYTLECFPMLIVCGGVAIAWMMGPRKNASGNVETSLRS